MNDETNVTVPVPLALQNLIRANNNLLKSYQSQLMSEIQEANLQLMGILNIDPSHGWRLDMERMVYIRTSDKTNNNAPVTE